MKWLSGNCLFPDSARFFSLSYLYLVFRHSETFPFVYLSRTYVVAPQPLLHQSKLWIAATEIHNADFLGFNYETEAEESLLSL